MKNWISVEDYLPELNQKVWYYFELLGKFKGTYGGLYEGREGMSIFYNDDGFLTGDVTHWLPCKEERLDEKV